MITCECGVEYPHPGLQQVVCRNGVIQQGYDNLPLIRIQSVPEFELCPCLCHKPLAVFYNGQTLDAVAVV